MAKTVKKTKPGSAKKAVPAKKSTATKGKTVKTKKVTAKPAAKKAAKPAPASKKVKAVVKAKTTVPAKNKAKVASQTKSQGAKATKKIANKPNKPTKVSVQKAVPAKKSITKTSKAVAKSTAKAPALVKTASKKTVEPSSKKVVSSKNGVVKTKTAAPNVKERPSQVSSSAKSQSKDLPRKKVPMRPVPSSDVSFDMPAPKKLQELILSKEEKLKLKRALLNKCIEIQKNNVARAKKAMEDAQDSANQEKGSSEELSDSFRETMQATRDMYARQVHEGVNTLALLNRIVVQEHEWVKFGSVIFTDYQNYFISSGLGEIKINDMSFITVSTLSPLFQILASKRKGEQFMFLDRMYRVVDVF